MKNLIVVSVLASAFSAASAHAACELERISWNQAQVVEVELDEYSFTPSEISLHACQPYVLLLKNVGRHDHNFSSPPFFNTTLVRNNTTFSLAPATFDALELDEGDMREIDLVPTQVGDYRLKCTHFMHAFHGMKGWINVTE